MITFSDSHCHLDFPDFEKELDEIVSRAQTAYVKHILTIGTTIASSDRIIEIAHKYPCVYATVGVHPEYAVQEKDIATQDVLLEKSKDAKVVGLGETGLDYHYTTKTKEEQSDLFQRHLCVGKKANLPVVVHSRQAEQDTITLLKKHASPNLTGVLHCFSSSQELAQAGLELGFYISASGILTFKKSDELRAIFQNIPLNKILIETDSPFLAPNPYRGKRNEPSYVVHTAQILAQIKGVSVEEFAHTTTQNFLTLFPKVKSL